uniref:Ig-like domain-containing protein n=1 Tax=Panagrellus redivivus TaxID=6233 RepID=A0A7E4W805_PANRE
MVHIDVKVKVMAFACFGLLVVALFDVLATSQARSASANVSATFTKYSTSLFYGSRIRFSYADKNVSAIAGQFHILECPNVNASNAVTWLIDGKDFGDFTPDARRYLEGAMLVFIPISAEDSGLYECFVGDKLFGTSKLTVQSKMEQHLFALMYYLVACALFAVLHAVYTTILCFQYPVIYIENAVAENLMDAYQTEFDDDLSSDSDSNTTSSN